jgi:hypothetical protein
MDHQTELQISLLWSDADEPDGLNTKDKSKKNLFIDENFALILEA